MDFHYSCRCPGKGLQLSHTNQFFPQQSLKNSLALAEEQWQSHPRLLDSQWPHLRDGHLRLSICPPIHALLHCPGRKARALAPKTYASSSSKQCSPAALVKFVTSSSSHTAQHQEHTSLASALCGHGARHTRGGLPPVQV